MTHEIPNNTLNTIPKPLVSIRTSTYNQEKYIRQCIEGVLMQKTDFPFEYIIGEDCSTDGTRAIVMEYALKYPDIIRVITDDSNVGMKANGIRCIERCRGKYIAICEGDDWWTDPDKLQKQVDYMEAHPECSLCFTSQGTFLEESGEYIEEPCNEIIKYGPADMIRGNWVGTLTSLYRSSIQKEYRELVEPKIPYFPLGDWTMWLYFSMKGEIVRLPQCTGVYRVLPHSASHMPDTFKQMRFIVETYRMREYFNKLLGINKPNMKFRTFRDTIRFSIRYAKVRNEATIPLLFSSLMYAIKNPAPSPSKELKADVSELLKKPL